MARWLSHLLGATVLLAAPGHAETNPIGDAEAGADAGSHRRVEAGRQAGTDAQETGDAKSDAKDAKAETKLADLEPPKSDGKHPAGNHAMLFCPTEDVTVVLAHLQSGSSVVQPGQHVRVEEEVLLPE